LADHAQIDGGPADGLTAAPGRRFEWLEVVVVKRTERTPGAALYELRDGAYSFVGGRQSVCVCGAVYQRAEGGAEDQGCPLCTSASLARTAPHG
jgi:hypothetical protein